LAACGHAGHAGHALTQLALLQFAVQVVEAERWNRSDEATARRPYIYIQYIYIHINNKYIYLVGFNGICIMVV
jgi:hypothetical protein